MGSNPAKDDGFLRLIKIYGMISFREEVKPSVPFCKIVQHVKDPYRMRDILRRQNSQTFLAKYLLLLY
jgi:hypothetical protein